MKKFLALLMLATLGAGCAQSPTVTSQAAARSMQAQNAQAAQMAFGTRILQAFERLPAGKNPKAPVQPLATLQQDPPEMPAVIVKIKAIAAAALSDSAAQTTWPMRWKMTDDGLQHVQDVKLTGFGKRNVPAIMGLLSARGYGYMGAHPTHENRYLTQVHVLRYLSNSSEEAHLTAGSPLFNLGGAMLDATTNHDQGLRVGISVLTVLGEYYQDKELRKQCQTLLETAAKQKDKELAYATLRSGLSDLARRPKG